MEKTGRGGLWPTAEDARASTVKTTPKVRRRSIERSFLLRCRLTIARGSSQLSSDSLRVGCPRACRTCKSFAVSVRPTRRPHLRDSVGAFPLGKKGADPRECEGRQYGRRFSGLGRVDPRLSGARASAVQ